MMEKNDREMPDERGNETVVEVPPPIIGVLEDKPDGSSFSFYGPNDEEPICSYERLRRKEDIKDSTYW
ncbi:hypothetical protein Tco_0802258 [Tanacetum coccineum]|uniref:Uncharacterized protein n=1 Tax=Tanacetum coccineum TaxID=301880 RepID=A0ABQ5A2C3_9ASTR